MAAALVANRQWLEAQQVQLRSAGAALRGVKEDLDRRESGVKAAEGAVAAAAERVAEGEAEVRRSSLEIAEIATRLAEREQTLRAEEARVGELRRRLAVAEARQRDAAGIGGRARRIGAGKPGGVEGVALGAAGVSTGGGQSKLDGGEEGSEVSQVTDAGESLDPMATVSVASLSRALRQAEASALHALVVEAVLALELHDGETTLHRTETLLAEARVSGQAGNSLPPALSVASDSSSPLLRLAAAAARRGAAAMPDAPAPAAVSTEEGDGSTAPVLGASDAPGTAETAGTGEAAIGSDGAPVRADNGEGSEAEGAAAGLEGRVAEERGAWRGRLARAEEAAAAALASQRAAARRELLQARHRFRALLVAKDTEITQAHEQLAAIGAALRRSGNSAAGYAAGLAARPREGTAGAATTGVIPVGGPPDGASRAPSSDSLPLWGDPASPAGWGGSALGASPSPSQESALGEEAGVYAQARQQAVVSREVERWRSRCLSLEARLKGAVDARRAWVMREAELLESNAEQARLLAAASNLQTNVQYLRNALTSAAESGPDGLDKALPVLGGFLECSPHELKRMENARAAARAQVEASSSLWGILAGAPSPSPSGGASAAEAPSPATLGGADSEPGRADKGRVQRMKKLLVEAERELGAARATIRAREQELAALRAAGLPPPPKMNGNR
jgi:hypothetical protein